MRRREFLKGAAIAPAAVAASRWSVAAEALGARSRRISAVVYDERYADCKMFAETLGRQGAVAYSIQGDAGRAWYGALREHLAACGGGVAGMTTEADRVVSRECGRELNLRLAYEGSHDGRTPGRLVHRLHGSGAEKEIYAALLRPDAPWAESIAEALSQPPLTDRIMNAIAGTPTLTMRSYPGQFGYLTTWLLMPSTGANRQG